MRRVDIVGFTLAELSLVLLYVFLALTLPSRNTLQTETTRLSQQVTSLQAEIQRLLREKSFLPEPKPAPPEEKPRLRSAATPSCIEKGIVADWLFTAIIRGRDAYEVHGRRLTLAGLLSMYQPQVSASKEAGCVHSAKIQLGAGVSAVDYDFALRRIEQNFYTKKLGPVE